LIPNVYAIAVLTTPSITTGISALTGERLVGLVAEDLT
jgi:hypothetical protein